MYTTTMLRLKKRVRGKKSDASQDEELRESLIEEILALLEEEGEYRKGRVGKGRKRVPIYHHHPTDKRVPVYRGRRGKRARTAFVRDGIGLTRRSTLGKTFTKRWIKHAARKAEEAADKPDLQPGDRVSIASWSRVKGVVRRIEKHLFEWVVVIQDRTGRYREISASAVEQVEE